MLVADRFRCPRAPKQVRNVAEIGVDVADVEQGLGGTLAGADDLDAQALLALEVLDGLDVVAVTGDEDIDVSMLGETHHVDDDAHIPVALVGYDALPVC